MPFPGAKGSISATHRGTSWPSGPKTKPQKKGPEKIQVLLHIDWFELVSLCLGHGPKLNISLSFPNFYLTLWGVFFILPHFHFDIWPSCSQDRSRISPIVPPIFH